MQPIETTSHYLFGKEADEIYSQKFKPKDIDVNIHSKVTFNKRINGYLELLMGINSHLLTRQVGFDLIDPKAGNNQCHLYALMAAEMQNSSATMSSAELSTHGEKQRFLQLALLLNMALLSNPVLFRDFGKAVVE